MIPYRTKLCHAKGRKVCPPGAAAAPMGSASSVMSHVSSVDRVFLKGIVFVTAVFLLFFPHGKAQFSSMKDKYRIAFSIDFAVQPGPQARTYQPSAG